MALQAICRPSALSATKPSGTTVNFVDGAGTAPSNIDPGASVTHDNDTSYRQATQPTRGDIWYCATGKPSAVATVYSSTASIRFRGAGYTPTYSVGFYSAEAILGTNQNGAPLDGTYSTLTKTATPSAAQVNAATFGIGWKTDSTNPVSSRVTSAWIVLNYDPPGGGFISIFSLVVGALGAGLGVEHMPGIARLLRTFGQGIPPEEYGRAVDELRSWARPRFLDLGAAAA